MRSRYFLDGAELSIVLSKSSLGEDFHLRSQRFFSLFMWFCRSADKLRGKCLRSRAGNDLASLESPCAANLASSSAFSFGAKSICPGTQWICKSMTPFGLPFHPLPSAMAASRSAWLIKPSCFLWRLSAVSWMPSRMYWPGWDLWLSSALKTA